jgi:hypothetical protein
MQAILNYLETITSNISLSRLYHQVHVTNEGNLSQILFVLEQIGPV